MCEGPVAANRSRASWTWEKCGVFCALLVSGTGYCPGFVKNQVSPLVNVPVS